MRSSNPDLLMIPEGQNPYVFYLHEIRNEIYGDKDLKGLEARFIVLIVLTIYYTILSFLYTGSVLEQSLRRNGGPGVWLWKKVPVGEASAAKGGSAKPPYIWVMNTKLCLSAGVLLEGIYLLFYLVDGINVYLHYGDQRREFPLRAFLPVPLCAVGWGLTWGILQAFTLMHTDKTRQITWAPWLNHGFVWGGVAWSALYLAGAISSAMAGTAYWEDNQRFTQWLHEREGTFIGTFGGQQAMDLRDRYIEYLKYRDHYAVLAQFLYGCLPAFATMILVINVSTILLTRMIKFRLTKQVANLAFIRSHAFEAHAASKTGGVTPLTRIVVRDSQIIEQQDPQYSDEDKCIDRGNFLDLGNGKKRNEDDSSPSTRSWTPGNTFRMTGGPALNLSEIREIVEQGETSLSAEEMNRLHAVQVLELDATRRFIVLVGLLIAMCASGCLAVACYVTATVGIDGPFWTNWIRFEITIYSFPWALALLISFMMTILIRVQFLSRRLWKARLKSRLMIRQQVQVEIEGP